jgi:Mce-associated membrane protein
VNTALADPQVTDAVDDPAPPQSATPAPEHRPPRRNITIGVIAVAAACFVGVCAFTAAALRASLADRADAATRAEVARSAAAAITTLWTYSPDTIDALPDRAGEYLGGEFHGQYRKFLEAAIAPTKQANITDTTEVVGVAVESLNGSDAVALVFTNTAATTPLTKNIPMLKYVAYRLSMMRQERRWLVTKMSTVSFMDLTPQL